LGIASGCKQLWYSVATGNSSATKAVAQRRKSAFQISYVTITYRSVLMGMLGVLLLSGVVMYFAFP